MNWERIKTFANFLVVGSCLLSVSVTIFYMNRIFVKLSEDGVVDPAGMSSDIGAQILLVSYLAPAFLFGIVLWIIA